MIRVIKEILVLKALKVTRVTKETKVLKVIKETRVQKAMLVVARNATSLRTLVTVNF